MKTYLFPILKSLGLTVGLNGLVLLYLYAVTPLVSHAWGRILAFLGVILMLTAAICLFTAIRAEKRRSVLLCGLAAAVSHLPAATVSVLIYGSRLSEYWPGSTDLAWLVFLLIVVAAWVLSVTVVTIAKLATRTAAAHRAQTGTLLRSAPITSARARLLAVLKGLLFTLWLHILTGLLFELLAMGDIVDTLLSYVAFPCLWCLMAAAYGVGDGQNRLAYALGAGVSNLALCSAATCFLAVANTTGSEHRARLYAEAMLTDPTSCAEQLLALALLLIVGIAMAVSAVAHRAETNATAEP